MRVHRRRFQDQRRIGRAIGQLVGLDRRDVAAVGGDNGHGFQLVEFGGHAGVLWLSQMRLN